MTGTNCDLFTHKSSRSYLNHHVYILSYIYFMYIDTLKPAQSKKIYFNSFFKGSVYSGFFCHLIFRNFRKLQKMTICFSMFVRLSA
jgi:hypothetical protein